MNKIIRLSVVLAAVLLQLAGAASAIELELQESREQRGYIGYVDMQKVFKAYPETVRAKENFEELVRQAEEQVNLRKAEALKLRNELSELKAQRELVARTPIVITPVLPEPPKVLPPPAPAPAPLAPVKSTGTATFSLPGLDKPVADAKKADALVINIPGVSTAPIVVAPPEATAEAPKLSTQPAAVAVATGTTQVLVQTNPALAELDAKIALKERDLAAKEADYKEFQSSQEKNLLELESRRTDVLLGKINKAVQEVAHSEGISVVVDKSNILFGHGAVDLTDKVLKKLSNP
jgi:Skp family chaperone for outer membrane proteins